MAVDKLKQATGVDCVEGEDSRLHDKDMLIVNLSLKRSLVLFQDKNTENCLAIDCRNSFYIL